MISFVNLHHYKSGETHSIHNHDDLEEVHICLQGSGKVLMGNNWVDFKRGDVLVSGLRERHSFRSSQKDPLVTSLYRR